jgi:predicted RND superfamily exporter protein
MLVQKQGNAEQEALSAGVIESISITVLVGLSVDYVVHLANSYIEADMEDVKKRHPRYKDGPADAELSTAEERELRVFGALEEMGVTVFGGACTSLGASGMLFLCYFQTFFKFGGFMFMTITTSFIFANFFFMPLLSVAGPTGKCCSFADTVSS